MAASSVSQCRWTSPERERRLGAGDVQDDQVVDRFGLDERGQVGGDAVDGLRVRSGAARPPPVGPAGRPPGPAPSSIPAGPAPRPRRARRGTRRSSPARRRPSCAGTPRPIGERGLADVVAADHEIARLRQRQALEQRQLGHQTGAVGQPPGHRRQPQRDRRADASECSTNQRPTR